MCLWHVHVCGMLVYVIVVCVVCCECICVHVRVCVHVLCVCVMADNSASLNFFHGTNLEQLCNDVNTSRTKPSWNFILTFLQWKSCK